MINYFPFSFHLTNHAAKVIRNIEPNKKLLLISSIILFIEAQTDPAGDNPAHFAAQSKSRRESGIGHPVLHPFCPIRPREDAPSRPKSAF